jgi:microcystin-dependent protein
MSEPFLSEIRMFGFDFAPRGWAKCDGQLLPINQYQSLYSLLGTMYGGDGRTSFGLPDLRGRVPLHKGPTNSTQGAKGGAESVALTTQQMPEHRHGVKCTSDDATGSSPDGTLFARATTNLYHGFDAANNTTINPGTLAEAGESQPHNNLQPYLVINFCIAISGLFPARN